MLTKSPHQSAEYKFDSLFLGHGPVLALVGLACSLVFAGCGKSSEPSESEQTATETTPATAPAMEALPSVYRFTAETPDETKARLGMQYRTVLAIPGQASGGDSQPTASYTSSPVQVPAQARLDFGIGVIPAAGEAPVPVTFTVTIQSGNTSQEIYSRELNTGDFAESAETQWLDERLDLGQWAGQEVRVAFFAHAAGSPYHGARWAAPILYSAVSRASNTPPNIIIISLDTLRADRLGCYGYSRDTSPNLDRLAAQSFVFEECIAPSSWTLPSHATLFTGLPPALHGAYVFSAPLLRDNFTTLSELARDAGYQTAAFTEGAYVGGALGFYQGFDLYSNAQQSGPSPRGQAKETFAHAQDWLDRHSDQPFMMFLHTYQIHWPYVPPDPYASKFTSSPVDSVKFFKEIREDDFSGTGFMVITNDPDKRQTLKDLYDAGISYTDALLGNLFTRIEQMGLLENTLIVVVSDHGEGFWEHGLASHGTVLYREMLHVPLIVRLPGKTPPAGRVSNLVALADVFPTVAKHMGVDHPVLGDAYDLNPLMTGGASAIPRQTVTAHLSQEQLNWVMVSVQNSTGRYIVTTNYAAVESPLYSLSNASQSYGPGVREAKLMDHLLSGGRDWWKVPAGPERDKMLASAREEIFLYPGDKLEASDESLADPESLRPYRQVLANEVNTWKALGASLKTDGALRPLTDAERAELCALGYISCAP